MLDVPSCLAQSGQCSVEVSGKRDFGNYSQCLGLKGRPHGGQVHFEAAESWKSSTRADHFYNYFHPESDD